MIQEAYCSFEVSKLLKERGFNEYCLKNYWSSDKELHDWKWELSYNRNSDGNRNTKDCAAPTHQMALAWLRSKYNIHIEVHYNRYGETYTYKIIYSAVELEDKSMGCFYTYEEAIEDALMQILTHKYNKDKNMNISQ